jgi:aspartate kinase
MMSADPHEIAAAQVIPTLSYDEVGELAYFGARILHTRMVAPLRQAQIPLRIKNVVKPQQPGTLIHAHASSESRRLKAVTAIGGLGLAADASGSLAPIAALVDETLFATTRSHADVMISAQSSAHSFVCFLIPTNAGPDAIHVTRTALEEALRQNPDTLTWKIKPVSIITVISNHFEYWSNPLADLLKALPGCRFLALAQGPSQCSFSLVVEPEFADDLLAKVHSHIIHHQ